MMTLKSAISELPHGGAKAVIMYPKHAFDRKKLMHAFGAFINKAQGQYITSMDVGTTAEDMDLIYERSPYVIGATKTMHNDPSLYTGLGISRGLEAAAKFRLQRDTLEGVHVAIQGAGKVSYALCKNLHAAKAKITICDINPNALSRYQEEFNAAVVDPEAIYDIRCDIFAPSRFMANSVVSSPFIMCAPTSMPTSSISVIGPTGKPNFFSALSTCKASAPSSSSSNASLL